jgi:hypothetical protein
MAGRGRRGAHGSGGELSRRAWMGYLERNKERRSVSEYKTP